MPEDFAQALEIHPALYCAGGKGMPKRVKAAVPEVQLFQDQFKALLVGSVGDHFPALGAEQKGSAPASLQLHAQDGDHVVGERNDPLGTPRLGLVDVVFELPVFFDVGHRLRDIQRAPFQIDILWRQGQKLP